MRRIGSFKEIGFLDGIVGAEIIQVVVDPYEIRLKLDSTEEINISSKIVFKSHRSEQILNIQSENKSLFDLYQILCKKVTSSYASGPLSWVIELENNVSMELIAGGDGYESIQGFIKTLDSYSFVI